MRRLTPIFDALLKVTGVLTEQLALLGLCDQRCPRSGEIATDREGLGCGVYVIKDKILSGSAANTAATQHGDQPGSPQVLALAVLGHDVGHTGIGHLSEMLSACLH